MVVTGADEAVPQSCHCFAHRVDGVNGAVGVVSVLRRVVAARMAEDLWEPELCVCLLERIEKRRSVILPPSLIHSNTPDLPLKAPST